MALSLSMTVNGKTVNASVDSRTLLAEFCAINSALTGTHVGCDTGAVRRLHRACRRACGQVVQHARGAGRTAPRDHDRGHCGAPNGTMHPMQAAFKDCHGLQCGFCTPGMVMSAIDLCSGIRKADEATIRAELDGNSVAARAITTSSRP